MEFNQSIVINPKMDENNTMQLPALVAMLDALGLRYYIHFDNPPDSLLMLTGKGNLDSCSLIVPCDNDYWDILVTMVEGFNLNSPKEDGEDLPMTIDDSADKELLAELSVYEISETLPATGKKGIRNLTILKDRRHILLDSLVDDLSYSFSHLPVFTEKSNHRFFSVVPGDVPDIEYYLKFKDEMVGRWDSKEFLIFNEQQPQNYAQAVNIADMVVILTYKESSCLKEAKMNMDLAKEQGKPFIVFFMNGLYKIDATYKKNVELLANLIENSHPKMRMEA